MFVRQVWFPVFAPCPSPTEPVTLFTGLDFGNDSRVCYNFFILTGEFFGLMLPFEPSVFIFFFGF